MSLKNTKGFLPVVVALGGNALVTAIKFFAALLSGSSALFSEAVHSFADTLNQLFLLIGLQRSLRIADSEHEYGYGNERFFWALISACGIFFVGAGITGYEGVHALLHPSELKFSPLVFIVLGVSFCIESYSFYMAAREMSQTHPLSSWRERIMEANSSTLAVLLEDSVAVLGIVIASAGIYLSYLSGSSVWDAASSIAISVLLALVAVVLIMRNRGHLIGRSMPEELRDEVIAFLKSEPTIEKIIDFKSNEIALGAYRIKCEVEWNGAALLPDIYRNSSMQEEYDNIRGDVEEFKKFSAEYADRIPRLMGTKIDEIEKKIRSRFPSIQHIDIEIN